MTTPTKTRGLKLLEGGRQTLIRRLISALASCQDAEIAEQLDRLEHRTVLQSVDARVLPPPVDRVPTTE